MRSICDDVCAEASGDLHPNFHYRESQTCGHKKIQLTLKPMFQLPSGPDSRKKKGRHAVVFSSDSFTN